MSLIGSLTGRLYEHFALTIAVAVLISAFNALSLSPALTSILLKPTDIELDGTGFHATHAQRVFHVNAEFTHLHSSCSLGSP